MSKRGSLSVAPNFIPSVKQALTKAVAVNLDHDLAVFLNGSLTILNNYFEIEGILDSGLKRSLQELKKQLPDFDKNEEKFKQWWETSGSAWTEQLRAVMNEHCNIGHDWQFSEQQQELLQKYYDANKLLVDCLNSGCNVTRSVEREIEETLFLPIVEIHKHG